MGKKRKKRMTDRDGAGRPGKATKENITKILQMIRVDASVEEACAYARIHYNTFYNRFSDDTEFLWEYMTTDPADPSGNSKIVVEEYCTFRELVEQARAYKYILAKKKVFEAISNGDSKMAMEFLRRRNKDYYDKQVNFEKDNSNLVDEVLSELAGESGEYQGGGEQEKAED